MNPETKKPSIGWQIVRGIVTAWALLFLASLIVRLWAAYH